MSAQSGWYPDPGGVEGLYRYWDGHAWSAATSPHPAAPPPSQALGLAPPPATYLAQGGQPYGSQSYGSQPIGVGGQAAQPAVPGEQGPTSAYANYQQTKKARSPVGWWIGAAALLSVIIIVGVIALRSIGGSGGILPTTPGGQPSANACPEQTSATIEPPQRPPDGRVYGGPVSYPRLGPPWQAPEGEFRVPFGRDVQSQTVTVEANYAPDTHWVASVLVGELQAGDGFFTPEQGAQIVVRCILGSFYGNNPVESDVQVNRATTIDGNQAWLVESQLSFDIEGLRTKGELLIVAVIATDTTAGLYYASIPDTRPELVQPARDALAALQVD